MYRLLVLSFLLFVPIMDDCFDNNTENCPEADTNGIEGPDGNPVSSRCQDVACEFIPTRGTDGKVVFQTIGGKKIALGARVCPLGTYETEKNNPFTYNTCTISDGPYYEPNTSTEEEYPCYFIVSCKGGTDKCTVSSTLVKLEGDIFYYSSVCKSDSTNPKTPVNIKNQIRCQDSVEGPLCEADLPNDPLPHGDLVE
jgi:hypothetical protein